MYDSAVRADTEPDRKNPPFCARLNQDNAKCIEAEIASLQFFAKYLDVKLGSKTGAVSFYFPID